MSSAAIAPPSAPEMPKLPARVLVQSLLDHIPDFVYFKDLQSRFLAVSKSVLPTFGGANPAQIIGRTDFDFFSERHARPAYEAEQQVIRTGEPIVGQVERLLWPDGHVTWVRSDRMPLRDRAGKIVGTFTLSRDITRTKEMELELETAHKALVDSSRIAGMAEVATGVLHNVGNVLNSLNVSASVVATGLRQSKAESLAKLAALLREQKADLPNFLQNDPRGRRVPEFLQSLSRHAIEERQRLARELQVLQKNVDHIKEIVSMQQAYATMIGVTEPLDPVMMVEDALRMNSDSLERHAVKVEREFEAVQPVFAEKAKVLQILVNLIRNAQIACNDSGLPQKCIILRLQTGPGETVRFVVQDTGVGIPPENITRIFQHGFTTRKEGHGFGLHSAANAAHEMKGSLTVQSAGSGLGATFILELPIAPTPAVA